MQQEIMNVYLGLTEEFNRGRVRAMISSGQAVVLHKVASREWAAAWSGIERETAGLPLDVAHARIVERALESLPFNP